MRDSSRSHNGSTSLPALGERGGGWVLAQFLLLAGIALSALVGLGWSGALAVVAPAVGIGLMVIGGILVVLGGVQLGTSLTPFPAPRPGGELSVAGVYALARHPIYGGAVLVALGWSIVFANVVGLVLTVLLFVFFELKARREESWLVDHYPEYATYRSRTRRKLLPWLY